MFLILKTFCLEKKLSKKAKTCIHKICFQCLRVAEHGQFFPPSSQNCLCTFYCHCCENTANWYETQRHPHPTPPPSLSLFFFNSTENLANCKIRNSVLVRIKWAWNVSFRNIYIHFSCYTNTVPGFLSFPREISRVCLKLTDCATLSPEVKMFR